MLDFMRRGAKSWVAKGLILLLIASFAVWGIGDIFSFSRDTAVATVGEQEVTAQAYADALERQRNQLSQQAGRLVSISEMRSMGFDRSALAQLIREAAYRAELEMFGIAAPDDAVAEAIRLNPAFHGPGGEFAQPAYETLLAQQGFTPQRFEALTRDVIGQSLITSSTTGTGLVPPGAATRIAAHQGEQRRVQLVRLTREMADAPEDPGNETLAGFVLQNRERFLEPTRRYGQYLFVDITALTADAMPDEDALRAAYDTSANRFRAPAAAVIEQINFPALDVAQEASGRIVSGAASFDEIAAEQGLAAEEIALGRVSRDELPETVADAVFALGAEGGVTEAVETPLGAAILRAAEVQTDAIAPFETVRDLLAQEMARETARFRAPEIASEADEMRAGGATFEEIAAAIDGVTRGVIDGLGADGTLAGGRPAEGALALSGAAREVEASLDLEERDFVELADGSYFLAYVERIEPARMPDLATIRERALAAWSDRARTDALLERAGRIVGGLSSGTGATLASVAAGLGRPVVELAPFTRDAVPAGLNPELVRNLFAGPAGGFVVGEDANDGSVVIAEIAEVIPLDPDALAEAAVEVETRMARSLASDNSEYLTFAIEAAYDVQTDRTAIGQVFALLGGGGAGTEPESDPDPAPEN